MESTSMVFQIFLLQAAWWVEWWSVAMQVLLLPTILATGSPAQHLSSGKSEQVRTCLTKHACCRQPAGLELNAQGLVSMSMSAAGSLVGQSWKGPPSHERPPPPGLLGSPRTATRPSCSTASLPVPFIPQPAA